jgi:hypothetical protein
MNNDNFEEFEQNIPDPKIICKMKLMPDWSSVIEKLPPLSTDVLIYDDWNEVAICRLITNGKEYYWKDRDEEAEFGVVTHWMPIPNPPRMNELD